jgi:hypothetical protein
LVIIFLIFLQRVENISRAGSASQSDSISREQNISPHSINASILRLRRTQAEIEAASTTLRAQLPQDAKTQVRPHVRRSNGHAQEVLSLFLKLISPSSMLMLLKLSTSKERPSRRNHHFGRNSPPCLETTPSQPKSQDEKITRNQ